MLDSLHILPLLIFPALAIVAALSDATSMTIPNWISAILVVLFFPIAFFAHAPLDQIGLCVAMGFGALVIGMIMFALHWVGGGDAKLFAASALWLGLSGAAPFLIWTAIAGGALALALLSARRFSEMTGLPVRKPGWVERLLAPAGDIPYGIAIAAGALMAFPQSMLMLSLQHPG